MKNTYPPLPDNISPIESGHLIGKCEWDLQTGAMLWSDELFKIFGLNPISFAPTPERTLELIYPADRAKVKAAWDKATKAGDDYCLEKRIVKPGGEVAYVLSIGTVIKDQNSKAVKLLDIFQDITKTKKIAGALDQTLNNLKARNQFIESVIECIPIGIAVNRIDDGTATFVNKRFAEIYGWQEGDFPDVPTFFEKIYPDKDYRNEITARILSDIQSGDPERMNWNNVTVTTSKGEKRIVDAKNIPLFDQNLMVSTVVDVTRAATQAAEVYQIKTNQDALINGTEDLIWSVDTQLKIITANRSFRDMIRTITGNDLEEGQDVLFKEFGEEQLAKWKTYYQRALAGEQFKIKDQIYNPAKQKTEHSLISLSPMFNADNVLFGVACYSKDITDETMNLLALEKTKAELERIMDSSLDMICSIDAGGKVLSMSAACKTILGYSPDELIGKPLFDHVYPDDLEKSEQMAGQVMQGTNITNFENRYVRKDGSTVPLFWSARWDADKQIRYGVARDATEMKKAEAELIQSEVKYKFLFENNPSPMFLWDFETGRIIDCNEEATLKYGYSRDEFLRLTIKDIRPEEDIPLIEEATKNREVYGNIHRKIWRHMKKDGEIMFMEVSGHLIEYNGRLVAINQNIDVTEKLKAEKDLIDSEERYKLLFFNSPLPMWLYDFDTFRILDVNDTSVTTYGYSREEFLRMTILDIRPPEEVPAVINMLKGSQLKEGVNHFGIYNHFKKDKTLIKADVSGYRFNYRGKDCMMVVCNDVTERENAFISLKENEQKLFDSRQQLALIYNNVKDVIFMIDVENNTRFKFISVNQSFTDSTGVPKESVINQYIDNIIPEPSLSFVKGKYREAIDTRAKITWEETTSYPTGVKTGIVTVTPIFDSDGRCTQLIGSVYDITERKKEEQHLRLLESVVTNTNDAVLITESGQAAEHGPKIIYVNEAFTQMTGYTADEVIGKSPRILQGPKTDRTELQRLSKSLSKNEGCEVTIINYKKNGKEFWVNFSISPVADEKGRITHWISIERDVTQKKKTEQLLTDAYNERNTILESIGDAFFAVDKNWIVTYWNKHAERVLMVNRNDIIGKNLWEVFSDSTDSESYRMYHKAIENKQVIHFEDYYDALAKWYEISAYPSGSGLSVYFKDITERKLIEQRVGAERNLLRTLIDNLPHTVYFKDKYGRKLISNKVDYEMLGAATEDEVLGKTDMENLPPDIASVGYTQDMTVLNTGIPLINHEHNYTSKSGQHVWLLTTKLPLFNETHEIVGLVGIGRDITEQKHAEQKLKELNAELEKNVRQLMISNTELEQFAYVASHDLQEPLRMVTSFLTQLEKKYGHVLDDKGKLYIHFATDGAKRMRQLILDLLEFSRVGHADDDVEEVDFNNLVNDVLALFRRKIEELNATIRVNNLPTLQTYKTPLRQVFQNLISNSLKYHRKDVPPVITISCSETKTHFRFSVEDNGIGIENEFFDKIFIIFQRLHIKDEYAGTGMGLAITKKIIENLGGEIWVESVEGAGSTFYFTIPKNRSHENNRHSAN